MFRALHRHPLSVDGYCVLEDKDWEKDKENDCEGKNVRPKKGEFKWKKPGYKTAKKIFKPIELNDYGSGEATMVSTRGKGKNKKKFVRKPLKEASCLFICIANVVYNWQCDYMEVKRHMAAVYCRLAKITKDHPHYSNVYQWLQEYLTQDGTARPFGPSMLKYAEDFMKSNHYGNSFDLRIFNLMTLANIVVYSLKGKEYHKGDSPV